MKLFRYIAIGVLCVLLLFSAVACAGEEKEQITTDVYAGFTKEGESLLGGAEAADINIKALSAVKREEGETVLTFRFAQGSRRSGSAEEVTGCGVPLYTARMTAQPYRFVVEFESPAYWDYTYDMDMQSDLIAATFQQSFVDHERLSIYFQLTSDAAFRVQESGDELHITLKPMQNDEQEKYFVTVNAFEDYCNGSFSSELGFLPTLASDLKNMLLISQPYDSQEEAETFMQYAVQEANVHEQKWTVTMLNDKQLPEYDASLDYVHVYDIPVVRIGGTERALDVLIPDGLFLCEGPQTGTYAFSRQVRTGIGSEETQYQELWMRDSYGNERKLTNFEFEAIEQAQFSPDGRKLAVLELAQGSTHLYVFDTDTYEILNDLSEMGFGSMTDCFIWNPLGNIIYAVTGSRTLQIHQFDYSVPDEQKRYALVEKNGADEGSIGYVDGELYFIQSSNMEEGSVIYKIRPEGGVRKKFLAGSEFSISNDNRYMCIVDANKMEGESTFSLYDFETGELTTVNDSFFVYDYFWSADCSKLYYVENRLTGKDDQLGDAGTDGGQDGETEEEAPADPEPADPYPYTLWVYDLKTHTSTALMDLRVADIIPSRTLPELYLNYYETDSQGHTGTRVTYVLSTEE